ncbi:MAG: dihydrofolate reductase [Xanthomonadales bacterium]|jgi:dihydrofolate reductase|nr:dihydrofolate reductase [Xanthomonadales bacterium]MDH4018124.1 dihydrofolate reductase [Xanthomonadales bacterium]
MKKSVTLIAAMGNNRAIGLEGRMPWHLPAELQHFKKTTMGKSIVMGRKTWQAIGRPLPGRQNIVVSRNPDFHAEGVDLATSLEGAVDISESNEVMVIGGGQLYALALPLARRMVLTLIDIEPEADTWFPEWDDGQWSQISEELFPVDDKNKLAYRIIELNRTLG